MRIRNLIKALETLKKCSNGLIFHTYWFVIFKLMRIRLQLITFMLIWIRIRILPLNLMGARNWVGVGLSYRLQRLAESIHGLLKVKKFRLRVFIFPNRTFIYIPLKLNKNKIKTSIATFILILFSEQTISMFAPSKHFSSFHSKLYVECFEIMCNFRTFAR